MFHQPQPTLGSHERSNSLFLSRAKKLTLPPLERWLRSIPLHIILLSTDILDNRIYSSFERWNEKKVDSDFSKFDEINRNTRGNRNRKYSREEEVGGWIEGK